MYLLIPYVIYYFPLKKKSYFKTYFYNLQNIADNSDLLYALFSNKPEILKNYINKKKSKEKLENLLQIQKKLEYYFALKANL